MVTFEKFLTSVRKKNGDRLLPITIERYSYFVNEYIDSFKDIDSHVKLIESMNAILNQRQSMVMYSGFRLYLLYRGVDKRDSLLKTLQTPEMHSSALRSKRFLQSKVLSRGELKRLFNECTSEEKLFFSALYDTACRRHELINIKYGDIVFKNNTDTIHAEINILGKGAKSRVVYFGKTTVDLLHELRGVMNKDDKVFVLRKLNGTPYKVQEQALYSFVTKKTLNILGRQMHPHCFRHTKLTHLADAGADALGLQKYAGHDNISTTMIYLEISSRRGRITFETYSQEIVVEGEEI